MLFLTLFLYQSRYPELSALGVFKFWFYHLKGEGAHECASDGISMYACFWLASQCSRKLHGTLAYSKLSALKTSPSNANNKRFSRPHIWQLHACKFPLDCHHSASSSSMGCAAQFAPFKDETLSSTISDYVNQYCLITSLGFTKQENLNKSRGWAILSFYPKTNSKTNQRSHPMHVYPFQYKNKQEKRSYLIWVLSFIMCLWHSSQDRELNIQTGSAFSSHEFSHQDKLPGIGTFFPCQIKCQLNFLLDKNTFYYGYTKELI